MTDILDASSQQQEIGTAKKERMFQVRKNYLKIIFLIFRDNEL